jgi:hypothetical protein
VPPYKDDSVLIIDVVQKTTDTTKISGIGAGKINRFGEAVPAPTQYGFVYST